MGRGRFEVVDDPAKEALAGDIARIKKAIEERPDISQQKLLATCELPETKGASLLQTETGKSWFRTRGEKKAWRYYVTLDEPR